MSPSSPVRILVVDDEEYIRDLLATSLRFQGFDVTTATDGHEALRLVPTFAPAIVLLDVTMPGVDGYEVCRRMRADHDDTPVIFLTARDGKDDVLHGFTQGADDYVAKPFRLEEVVARVHAVLKRTGAAGAASEAAVHRYADLAMDDDRHEVTRHGVAIDLSPTEYKVLRYLLLNAERVVSKQQITEHVWNYDYGGSASSVETYISYLRKKVDAVEPRLIRTVRGVGYTLRTDR